MRIIQTIERVWEIDEVALAEMAEPEYWDWVTSDEGVLDDFRGFVKASVKELGTEVYGLVLIDSDMSFWYPQEEQT